MVNLRKDVRPGAVEFSRNDAPSARLHIAGVSHSGRMPGPCRTSLLLEDAIMLFRRLGVDVQSLAAHEFTLAYFRLAKPICWGR
jgi:hypothetical protein